MWFGGLRKSIPTSQEPDWFIPNWLSFLCYTLCPHRLLSLFTFKSSTKHSSFQAQASPSTIWLGFLFVSSISNHSNGLSAGLNWEEEEKKKKREGETVLSSATSGRTPSSDRQRHPLKKQHLSGGVGDAVGRDVLGGSSVGRLQAFFSLPHWF